MFHCVLTEEETEETVVVLMYMSVYTTGLKKAHLGFLPLL